MLSKRVSQMFYLSCQISRYFGASTLIFNPLTEQTTIDKSTISKLNRNFKLALTWQILAFILVLKRYHDYDNIEQLHLTIAWYLGYTLIVIVYSIFRFHTPALCDTINGLVKFLQDLHGKLKHKFVI